VKEFIKHLPKAELHLHIEGTFEPELIFKIAKRNNIVLSYESIRALKQAYQFTNLQSFLNLYFEALNVLQTEQDFYDLTWAYLERAKEDGVCHVEIFFNPQAHTERGIAFATVVNGITKALQNAQMMLDMTSGLIMDFTRTYSVDKAMQTLEAALRFKDQIIAVGLDSTEKGYPPELFTKVFERARQEGFRTVAHAGEEASADYIWQAIQLLNVTRIDHGVKATEDEKLMGYLSEHQIPLTICPLSNIKLCVYKNMSEHPIMVLYKKGIRVTINSDDPAYFDGYIAENYAAVQETFDLSKNDLAQLAVNSFKASFISEELKSQYIKQVQTYLAAQYEQKQQLLCRM